MQNLILTGTFQGKPITLAGSIPSAADISAATQPAILQAIAALKADMDAQFASVLAAIHAIPVSPPSPPPPPPPADWVQRTAAPSDQPFMPVPTPSATSTDQQKYSNPVLPVPPNPDTGPISVDTVIPSGLFTQVMDITNNAKVTGAGMECQVGTAAATIFDGTKKRPIYRKAMAVFEGSSVPGGAVLSNITIRQWDVSQADGQNAAGVCNGAHGHPAAPYDYTLDHVEVYGCQQGARGLGGNVNFFNSHFHHNGTDSCSTTGCTHNTYLNEDGGISDLDVVTATHSVWRKSLYAHEFKSRAGSHIMTGCVFDSRLIPGSGLGGNGACVDNSDGGKWQGKNNIYIKGAGAPNHNFITHDQDAEAGDWQQDWFDDSPVFVNYVGVAHIVVEGGRTITLNNPIFIGPRPDFTGNVVITGTPQDLPATAPIPFPPEVLALFQNGQYPGDNG